MRRISYLSARILHRCKKDKTKLYPGKLVYATSSNKYGFKSGSLIKVSYLLKNTNWRGDPTGFIEAPLIEEVREAIKNKLKLEIFPLPTLIGIELKYKVGVVDLETLSVGVDESFYPSYEDAIEQGCMRVIREFKGTNLSEGSFEE